MVGTRRKARIVALQALYEFDCTRHDPLSSAFRLIQENNLPKDASSFVQELVVGVIKNEEEIDATIQKFAPNFPVDQLSIIDRNILRLATFEILFSDEVPLKVAINEAVEMAKSFGSQNSPKFVNGVLGSVSSIAPRG